MAANIYENMLVTMGLYAGEMDRNNTINLPTGNEGEDILADFCVDAVEKYLENENDTPFCEYAESLLREKFPPDDFRDAMQRTAIAKESMLGSCGIIMQLVSALANRVRNIPVEPVKTHAEQVEALESIIKKARYLLSEANIYGKE